jgi:F0F1-type ATP synthase assembly protein I
MSLRAFHILFIVVTTVLAAGCAVWGFANGVAPAFGIICAAISVALFVYGVYFFRKSRKLIL